MGIPEEPGAVLVSLLVIVMSLLLISSGRGTLSEKKQTGVWIVFAILFFSVCSLFFRGNAEAGPAVPGPAGSPVVVEASQAPRGK
jgi:hypothetical protein